MQFDQILQSESATVAFTVIDNLKGDMCKHFSLDENGGLVTKSRAKLWEGEHHQECAASIDGLSFVRGVYADIPSRFFVYGIAERESGLLLTKGEVHRAPGAIARSPEYLPFPKGRAAVVCLDYDPKKEPGARPLNWRELDERLCGACPSLREVRRVTFPSGLRH